MITSLLQPEQASPDFLVERKAIVGEGTLPDQLARSTDLYIAKRQGNRMVGLADLSGDLGNIAEQNGRKGISSWMSRLHKGFGTTDDYTSSSSLTMMPITLFIGILFIAAPNLTIN